VSPQNSLDTDREYGETQAGAHSRCGHKADVPQLANNVHFFRMLSNLLFEVRSSAGTTILSRKEAIVKRLSRIQLLTCLCAAIALVPGVSSALMCGGGLVDAVSSTSLHQHFTHPVWSADGKGGAVTGKANSEQASDIRTRVDDFVHRRYIHGVPYLKAKKLGSEALPTLEAMLRDTSETEHWDIIVTTMGYIGDSSSVVTLVDFIENRFKGEVNSWQCVALLSSIGALGHIAGNGSSSALEYLSKACYVKTWEAKALKWHFRKYSGERLAIVLAKFGVNGLSKSGTERARELLLNLERHPESAKSESALKPNIEEGLQRIDRIQKEGALKVFEKQNDEG